MPKRTMPKWMAKQMQPSETAGTEYTAETVRCSGRWFRIGKWFVRREGNEPDGEILAYHDGYGNITEGPPPSERPIEEED